MGDGAMDTSDDGVENERSRLRAYKLHQSATSGCRLAEIYLHMQDENVQAALLQAVK